jgi:hypothetical protein
LFKDCAELHGIVHVGMMTFLPIAEQNGEEVLDAYLFAI